MSMSYDRKWLYAYILLSLFWAVVIETVNSSRGGVMGIGMIGYCLIMILYLKIFERSKK